MGGRRAGAVPSEAGRRSQGDTVSLPSTALSACLWGARLLQAPAGAHRSTSTASSTGWPPPIMSPRAASSRPSSATYSLLRSRRAVGRGGHAQEWWAARHAGRARAAAGRGGRWGGRRQRRRERRRHPPQPRSQLGVQQVVTAVELPQDRLQLVDLRACGARAGRQLCSAGRACPSGLLRRLHRICRRHRERRSSHRPALALNSTRSIASWQFLRLAASVWADMVLRGSCKERAVRK